MLAILIAGYTILIFQISKDKNREVCIEVDNAVDREETVGVEMHIVKSWDDKRKYGWDSSGAQQEQLYAAGLADCSSDAGKEPH